MDDIHKHFWFHPAMQPECPERFEKKNEIKELQNYSTSLSINMMMNFK